MPEINKMLKQICSAENIIIYGAGVIAESVIRLLTSDYYHIKITGCAVSDKKENKSILCGIPVYQIDELVQYKGQCLFLVATMDKNLSAILSTIRANGFEDEVLSFTFESDFWNDIREKYLRNFLLVMGMFIYV